jgi:protein-tyrosine phosphatase
VIDLHCHVLPGIDDGPGALDGALELAATAAGNGIATIVATPHVSWDYPANDAARIGAAVAELNPALQAAGIPVTVLAGAEVALTRGADLSDDELRSLRLGGGPYLLLECPLSPSATGFEQGLWELRARGHQVLLAHPERSPHFQRDPGALERLAAEGVLAQVTAASLTGRFGREAQRAGLGWLAAGLVHNVASDAHSAHRRPPSIAAELTEAGLGEHAGALADALPAAILGGGALPAAPVARPPRRRFGLRRR